MIFITFPHPPKPFSFLTQLFSQIEKKTSCFPAILSSREKFGFGNFPEVFVYIKYGIKSISYLYGGWYFPWQALCINNSWFNFLSCEEIHQHAQQYHRLPLDSGKMAH